MKSIPARYLNPLRVILPLTLVSILLRLYTGWPTLSVAEHAALALYSFAALWILWFGFDYINRFLGRRLPFSAGLLRRIIVHTLCNWALLMCIRWPNMLIFKDRMPFELNWLNYWMILMIDLFLGLAISLGFGVHFLLLRWKEGLIRTERLEKEKAMMQIHNLRNRVNPHFLFNALSALDGLIKTEPELASRFLQHLSKVYRYSLQNEDRESVSLDKEYAVFRHFSSLLAIRYGPALQIEVQLEPEALDKGIVPLTLEMLSENALKHNEVSVENPLYIRIWNNGDILIVENTLRLKKTMETSNGKGLQQLKNLYAWLSAGPFSAGEEQGKFIVKLPLL